MLELGSDPVWQGRSGQVHGDRQPGALSGPGPEPQHRHPW
jgi:hypothetical protein